ncbi:MULTISPECIES: hypothetical protein [Burkholderia]|uniref:hypothetical protein n=1 Tax=Burkholderia TaxID=32008 RepID=UPI0008421ACA|nr:MULTISPECIES: hypothetical protein [Burkholderia]
MKPLPLLAACGVVVSLALATAARAGPPLSKPHERRDQVALSPADAAAHRNQSSVPRGDLRGDIASNARERDDAQRPRNPNRQ